MDQVGAHSDDKRRISVYWHFGRYQSNVAYTKGSLELLKPVAAALHRALLASQGDGQDELVGQDRHLSISLGKPVDDALVEPGLMPRLRLLPPLEDNIQYLHLITARVRHWQCPQYSTRELIRRPKGTVHPDNRFLAFVKSYWACEALFGPDKSRNEILFNELQILNAIQSPGVFPGINPFLGIVLDNVTGLISGFLTAIPAKAPIVRLLGKANRDGRPIPWARREKWCRQIVEGLAVIHAADKVAGCLGDRPEFKVSVDANDNAVFWGRFMAYFSDVFYEGTIPPEVYDRLQSTSPSTSEVPITPETDVYQMGLALWAIATSRPRTSQFDFCSIAGCCRSRDVSCDQAHADPVQLPLEGLGIPAYLQQVIRACRTEVHTGLPHTSC